MNIVAIIPARGGSQRLPRKNIYPVLGKPMLAWTIEAAAHCPYLGLNRVFVTTDDAEIAQVAGAYGARVITRPPDLAGPEIWTEPVIQQAVESLEIQGYVCDLVVWLNACVPELTADDITAAIDRLQRENLREVISVDANLRSNSAVRVLRREALFQQRLSVVFGIVALPYVDIHYAVDVQAVEERLREKGASIAPPPVDGGPVAMRAVEPDGNPKGTFGNEQATHDKQ
jgi:CMP-2-keto-3-deoxyoctulosonic acid synthetase